MNAKRLLEAAPQWFQSDARRYGASVDLRTTSGYKALMGTDFFAFFRDPDNADGEADGWKWSVRRVDGLINLTVTKR